MAIISNFELLYKPIAPVVGPPAEIGRVAVQGYFLEISNLENRDIILIFRARTPVRDPAVDGVNTEFTATNNVVAYDITADNVFDTTMTSAGMPTLRTQNGHYVNCLILPAGQTASLAILPDVRNLFANPVADLAIRGYTELLLSSNIDSFNPLTFSAPESARILVSAEHRGTFIDPEFDPSNALNQPDLDFDQLAYSLLTANGKALQIINTHAPCNDPFQNLLTSDALSGRMATGTPNIALNPNFDISSSSFPSKQPKLTLSSLSSTLYKNANSPKRSLSFKFGITPIKIDYSIKNGKYIVDEKSTVKAINLLMKRGKVSKKLVDAKLLTKKINLALSGDKKADAFVKKMFKQLSI